MASTLNVLLTGVSHDILPCLFDKMFKNYTRCNFYILKSWTPDLADMASKYAYEHFYPVILSDDDEELKQKLETEKNTAILCVVSDESDEGILFLTERAIQISDELNIQSKIYNVTTDKFLTKDKFAAFKKERLRGMS